MIEAPRTTPQHPFPALDAGRLGDDSAKCIRVNNIVKDYHTTIGVRRVLDVISFKIEPGEKIAVLGRNGAGKSTLVKIVGGVEPPTSGTVERNMSMSWPVGFGGGVAPTMSGYDNIRFIARIYKKPFREIAEFVDDFAELGKQLYVPVKSYSAGMRARLAFALTLAIDFECFLIDEVFAVGDQRFHQKSHEALFEARQGCAMILVSHDIGLLKDYCSKALILKDGRGRVFEDLDLALRIYASI